MNESNKTHLSIKSLSESDLKEVVRMPNTSNSHNCLYLRIYIKKYIKYKIQNVYFSDIAQFCNKTVYCT